MSQRRPKPPAKPRNKPTENKTSESKWNKLKEPMTIISGIVTLLLALFTYYHTQQKETWENRQKLQQLEIDKVKQELATDRTKSLPPPANGIVPIGSMGKINIMKSQTASAPDLSITLDDTVFKADPSRFTVNARVAYKDLPVTQIRNGEKGYKVTNQLYDGYVIEIADVDAVSATFAITKSPN